MIEPADEDEQPSADDAGRIVDELRAAAAALDAEGRSAEALDVTEEAVATARGLVASDAERFRPLLAVALSNLAARRWQRGAPADALAASEESLSLFDRLAEVAGPGGSVDPTSTAARHLATLENHAIFLRGSAAPDKSVETRRRVLALRQEQLTAVPPSEATIRAVASALTLLVAELLAAQHIDEAETAIDGTEAVVRDLLDPVDPVDPGLADTHHEQLAAIGRLRGGLLAPLHGRAVALAEQGDHAGALEANDRAVVIGRRLVDLDRPTYRVHLAAAHDQRSSLLARVDRSEDALDASRDAVELLTDPTGEEVLHAARALHHLASRLGRLGAHQEALAAARDAAASFEQLAAIDPAAGGPMLLTARHDLANRLGGLGHHDAAIDVARSAVDDARRLVAGDRGMHLPSLVACLDHLSTLLAAAGSAREARKVRREHDRLRPEARRIVRARRAADLPS